MCNLTSVPGAFLFVFTNYLDGPGLDWWGVQEPLSTPDGYPVVWADMWGGSLVYIDLEPISLTCLHKWHSNTALLFSMLPSCCMWPQVNGCMWYGHGYVESEKGETTFSSTIHPHLKLYWFCSIVCNAVYIENFHSQLSLSTVWPIIHQIVKINLNRYKHNMSSM